MDILDKIKKDIESRNNDLYAIKLISVEKEEEKEEEKKPKKLSERQLFKGMKKNKK